VDTHQSALKALQGILDDSQPAEQYETSLQAEQALSWIFFLQHQSHRFPLHFGSNEVTSDGTQRMTSPGAIVSSGLTMALLRACTSGTRRIFVFEDFAITPTLLGIRDKRATPAR